MSSAPGTTAVKKEASRFRLLVLILFAVLAAPYGASGQLFEPEVRYDAGNAPFAATHGDLDADGDEDLVVMNTVDSSITVLENDGTGAFSVRDTYGLFNGPLDSVVAQLDTAGGLDVAVTVHRSFKITTYSNDGAGNLGLTGDYSVAGHPYELVADDFDGDGDLDLASANPNQGPNVSNAGSVSILWNDGDGAFTVQNISFDGGPISIVSADVDCDGDADLAAALHYVDTLAVLLNNGDGTFQSPAFHHVGHAQRSLVSADFNHDCASDLAVSSTGFSTEMSVLMSNGDGTFASPVVHHVGRGPQSGVAEDLTEDGFHDLVFASPPDHLISVLVNNGDGTFQSPIDYPIPGYAYWVEAADLDGDEDSDLAVVANHTGTVSILRNTTYECGNGAVDPTDECDDGNNTDEDGCSAVCLAEICGDGVTQGGLGEECDDANATNGDGCSASCLDEVAVSVDIKPGSDPNCVKQTHKGRLPVGLFGNGIDVTNINPASIELDGNADPDNPPGIKPSRIRRRDIDGDGNTDLILLFSNVALNDAGLLVDGGQLFVTGDLTDGSPIVGSDQIFLAGGPSCFD